jgi:small-conductance mechanosensitive channel
MVLDILKNLLPSVATLLLIGAGLFVTHRFILRAHTASTGKKFRNQMIMLGLSVTGALLMIMVLPISDDKRGQILSLLGIVVSAGIALSSATILGNAMAGFMIRAVRAFRLGDYIETGDHFGRVSDMGVFHTEIQTEDRDLKTLPNLMLVTNAVKRIRPSGTIISAKVSLGYDVPTSRVQNLLLQAAEKSGLDDPFVRILELGDYAVTYKVAGFLKDISQLLATRSDLRTAMLNALHAGGVEIVSPEFRNTRLVDQRTFIPAREENADEAPKSRPETVVFDKAEEAASIESLRQMISEIEDQKEELEKLAKTGDSSQQEEHEKELARIDRRLERLVKLIAARESKAAEKE